MSLISYPECSLNSSSDKEKSCPACGCPIAENFDSTTISNQATSAPEINHNKVTIQQYQYVIDLSFVTHG